MSDMTALELVEAFEREAGDQWFGTMPNGVRTTNVSPPHPTIVPTWPRLIMERALAARPASDTGLREALTEVLAIVEETSASLPSLDRAAVERIVRAALATPPLDAERLIGYLWIATGKNPDVRVCDLFSPDDPLVRDVEGVLARLTEEPR